MQQFRMGAADALSILPPDYIGQRRIATRYLYLGRKPGRVTCLFQPHVSNHTIPSHFQVYPSALEHDWEFKRLENARIYAISYILRGSCRIRYPDEAKQHELKAGTMFQFNGHLLEELRLEAGEGLFECSLGFDGTTGEYLDKLDIWNSSIRITTPGLSEAIIRAYLDVYNVILDHSLPARSILGGCMRFLEQVYSLVDSGDSDTSFRTRACGIIAGNLAPSFTMREAARIMSVPYETFRRKFKVLVGIAPIEYQLRLRMEQACMLLVHHSVKETAILLGYGDQFVFSRQFKGMTGKTPKDYKLSTVA